MVVTKRVRRWMGYPPGIATAVSALLREVLVSNMKSTHHSNRQGCIKWLEAMLLEKIGAHVKVTVDGPRRLSHQGRCLPAMAGNPPKTVGRKCLQHGLFLRCTQAPPGDVNFESTFQRPCKDGSDQSKTELGDSNVFLSLHMVLSSVRFPRYVTQLILRYPSISCGRWQPVDKLHGIDA